MCGKIIEYSVPHTLLYYMNLTIAIHLFVVGLIVSRGYILKPLLIVEIPTDGLLDAFLELEIALRSSVGRGVLPPLCAGGYTQYPLFRSRPSSSFWEFVEE